MNEDAPRENAVSPDDLHIDESDYVVPLGDNRYLVSSNLIDDAMAERIRTAVNDTGSSQPVEAAGEGEAPAGVPMEMAVARSMLEQSITTAEGEFVFDITAKAGGSVSHHRSVTNDVSTAFDRLLMWFAHHVSEDTPVEEVLGILLLESAVPVEFPADVEAEADRYANDEPPRISDLFERVLSALEDR